LLEAAGQPYAELAIVRVVDTRQSMAIAQIELSCEPVSPGDLAIAFSGYAEIPPHAPIVFDRFLPVTTQHPGRIVLAKHFDYELGTGMTVYVNLGAADGLQPGDYLRAFRTYVEERQDPADSLSFVAAQTDDTQKFPPLIDPSWLTRRKGPVIR